MPVDRCVCRDVPFETIRIVAERVGGDLDALSAATGCATGCRMCLPYIRRMLATGQTSQPVMTAAEFQRWSEPVSSK